MKNKYRNAIFIVTYRCINKDKILYLILKRQLHWKGWEFPKGGIDFFETKKRAIKRELKEKDPIQNNLSDSIQKEING